MGPGTTNNAQRQDTRRQTETATKTRGEEEWDKKEGGDEEEEAGDKEDSGNDAEGDGNGDDDDEGK